jgi:hypothetical protein
MSKNNYRKASRGAFLRQPPTRLRSTVSNKVPLTVIFVFHLDKNQIDTYIILWMYSRKEKQLNGSVGRNPIGKYF